VTYERVMTGDERRESDGEADSDAAREPDGTDPDETATPDDDSRTEDLPSEGRHGERREAEAPPSDDLESRPGVDGPGDVPDPDPYPDADDPTETEGGSGTESGSETEPEPEPETEDGAETSEATGGASDAVQSDGGALASTGPNYEDGFIDDSGDEPLGGPSSDKEMPLADHIEEMVSRLGVVILAMSVVSVLVLPFSVDLINFIWYSILGSVQDVPTEPRIYRPLALVLSRLKMATLVGFVAALPVFVYETYLFMRPGLYQHERRYYLAAVPTSLVLAFVGVAFAFYLVLPALFTYFVSYTVEAAGIAFGLTDTFGLMLLMMGFFAAVFQIPLLIMLAVMMGLTTRRWLADRRLYFWGGFLGIALLFSPDPTGMAPIIVALTMVALFEGTLLLLRWTHR